MWQNKFTKFFLTLLIIMMSTMTHAKRKPPQDVTPLVHGGIKYVVVHYSIHNSTGKNGGYIEARNE